MKPGARAAVLILAATFLLPLPLAGVEQSPQQKTGSSPPSPASEPSKNSAQPVPPYFKSLKAAEPLPPVLPAERFKKWPIVERAYALAARIPGVLAQEPCYCPCNRELAHRSLLDCYASDHTAGCSICVREAYLAYQLTKQGRTPAQIRQAIIHGDWKNVDLLNPPSLTP